MRKLKICLYVILCIFVSISCNSTKASKTKDVSLETLIDQNWHSILENGKIKMRDAWLVRCNPIKDFPEQKYGSDYYYFTSEAQIKHCEVVPVEHFKMDSQLSLKLSVDSTFPIENLLSLSKDLADFYVFKGDTILYIVNMKFMNNQWAWRSYGPIDKKIIRSYCTFILPKKD